MALHTIDANTFALYDFNESSGTTLGDVSGNARHMTWVGSPTVIGGLSGNARTLNGSTQYAELLSDANWRTLFTASTGWTIEAWVRIPLASGGSTRQYFFSNAGSFSGETLANNALCSTIMTNGGGYGIFWEHSTGTNGIDQQSNDRALGQGRWSHIAWRRNAGTPTATTDVFINGQLVRTYSAATLAAGGTAATQYNHIGRFYRDNSGNSWSGDIDEIRISDIPRTNSEIGTSYQAGLGISATPPTISNLSPANGQRIGVTQTISFDLTLSDVGGLAKTMVWAQYSNGLSELVCEGIAFTPAFAADSTTVAITNGYTYTLSRRGGWPLPPSISVSAISVGGLENG
jgi:hypothetical protein